MRRLEAQRRAVPFVDHDVATDRQMLFVDPVDVCIREGRVAEQAASRPGQQGMSSGRQPASRFRANLRRLRESVVASAPRDREADGHTLARALALELTPVRVNAVTPGLIDTPLSTMTRCEPYDRAASGIG